jgi:hypothetical protein
MAENQNDQDIADPAVFPIDHDQVVQAANIEMMLKVQQTKLSEFWASHTKDIITASGLKKRIDKRMTADNGVKFLTGEIGTIPEFLFIWIQPCSSVIYLPPELLHKKATAYIWSPATTKQPTTTITPPPKITSNLKLRLRKNIDYQSLYSSQSKGIKKRQKLLVFAQASSDHGHEAYSNVLLPFNFSNLPQLQTKIDKHLNNSFTK